MIFLKADLESGDHRDSKNICIIFVPQNLSKPTQEVTVSRGVYYLHRRILIFLNSDSVNLGRGTADIHKYN